MIVGDSLLIDWFKKWYLLMTYSIVLILLLLYFHYFSSNVEGFDFSNKISLLVGLMALWGIIYTSIVNKDNVLLQIENSNNQLRLQFNSENRLKALISLKKVLNNILSTKQPNLLGGYTSTTRKNTLWFERNRPFYLHYLPTEVRSKVKKINKKVETDYLGSEEYYNDIRLLCIYVNKKIRDMVDLKVLDDLYK